jgi:hypothetical protein
MTPHLRRLRIAGLRVVAKNDASGNRVYHDHDTGRLIAFAPASAVRMYGEAWLDREMRIWIENDVTCSPCRGPRASLTVNNERGTLGIEPVPRPPAVLSEARNGG